MSRLMRVLAALAAVVASATAAHAGQTGTPPLTPARAPAHARTQTGAQAHVRIPAQPQTHSDTGSRTGDQTGDRADTQVESDDQAQTRADALRAERAAKAADASSYTPNIAERALSPIETRGLYLVAREGLYPKLGSLTTGGGMAYGVGYRDRDLLRHKGVIELYAAASRRRYWTLDARAALTPLSNRVLAEAHVQRLEYPSEDFFGIGPDSRRRDHSNFMLRNTIAGGRLGWRPAKLVLVGGGLEFVTPRASRGRNDDAPSIDEVFRPEDVPGLNTVADFVRANAFLEVDYREPLNARQGGWYRFDVSHYDDRTAGRYSFNRFGADVRQYIGLLAGRRVLALRGWISSAVAEEGQRVPFYLMPYLGGHDTLRGFREYRFRGSHAMLLQIEYRWEIWSALDAAIFYDAGKVTASRRHLNLDDLERDFGFGLRFNTDNGVLLRVDAGFGSRDGRRLCVVFGGVF